MRVLRCPGGYPVCETVRRVIVRKIHINPNVAGTAIACKLTNRTAHAGSYYPPILDIQDGVGLVTLPYTFDSTPLVCNDGIRAETLTNCGNGSVAAPKNGVMIYVE